MSLAAKIALAALVLASSARSVSAEQAVGLDAQGVDPLVALHNPHNLDVRDALGRPVSGALVAKELGLAARARATVASFASRLPKARLLAALAEFFAAAPLAALSSPRSLPLAREVFAAAPTDRPDTKVLLLLAFLLPVCAASAWSTQRATPIYARRSHRKVDAMRC